MPPVLTPNQQLWLKALRSGDYQRGYVFLTKDDRFTALGVACDLFCPSSSLYTLHHSLEFHLWDGCRTDPPEYVVKALNLREPADIQDLEDLTFDALADRIEAQPKEFFLSC